MRENKDLNYYLAAWNLSHPQLLTQTRTSHIYTVAHQNETVVLKLLAAAETKEQTGAFALRYFDGRGAVRLLRCDAGAHLVEYAAGDELVTLVKHGEDEKATRIIAQVIQQKLAEFKEKGTDDETIMKAFHDEMSSVRDGSQADA